MTPMRAIGIAGLLAGFVLGSCGTAAPSSDAPVRQVVKLKAGLQLTATLDHRRLREGGTLLLQLELKNTGSTPIGIPSSYCRVTPVTQIQDSAGTVVWSEPIPMLECANPPADEAPALQPGASRAASSCWQLAESAASCARLNLPAGSYRVLGTFLTYSIPALGFEITR